MDLEISPLVRSLVKSFSENSLNAFSENSLNAFPDFIHEFRGQFGTKNDLGQIFQKNLEFIKIRKKWPKMRFFRISSKMAQRIFLIFRQNIELNSVFQPAKIVCENHFRSGVISDQRCIPRLITEWSSSFHFISCSKTNGYSWNFQIFKWSSHSFEINYGVLILSVLTQSCLSQADISLLNDTHHYWMIFVL